jgi:antirestriction protein
MNHEHQQGGESEDEPRSEREPEIRPRIYVASLADYNAGRLHGAWVDAGVGAERLAEEIAGMLERSPTPGAEEWAIHDYEGFGPLRLGEYEPIERVARLAEGIAEHGQAFAHWVAIVDPSDPEPGEGFEDCYLGHWRSLEAYAENLVSDLGYEELLERVIPDTLRPYVRFDVGAFARDLELGGEIIASEGEGGVYVFGTTR